MAESLSLLEFIRELLTNVELRDYFAQEPEKALQEYGLDDVSAADVHDALTLVQEDNQEADFSRNYDTGWNGVGGHRGGGEGGHAPAPHGHESAAEYVSRYITNNYIDDRDTIVDNSVNQQIDTGGGDFDQDIDVHSVTASGDGSVAAGGDIRDSTVTTGHGNQVGDGNISGNGNVVGNGNAAVTGHDNTVSFGSGNATSTDVGGDVNVGDGGAFASGGNASVDNSDNSQHDVGNHWTDASVNDSGNDYSDNSVEDSHNSETDLSQHGSNNTHNESTTEDSYNSHHSFDLHS